MSYGVFVATRSFYDLLDEVQSAVVVLTKSHVGAVSELAVLGSERYRGLRAGSLVGHRNAMPVGRLELLSTRESHGALKTFLLCQLSLALDAAVKVTLGILHLLRLEVLTHVFLNFGKRFTLIDQLNAGVGEALLSRLGQLPDGHLARRAERPLAPYLLVERLDGANSVDAHHHLLLGEAILEELPDG